AASAGPRVSLSWDAAAGGSAPSAFLVTVTGTFAATIRATGRAFEAAAPPGSYVVSVAAENACGTSAPTAARLLQVP
ncbi:MAG: hypothetical protein AB7O28_08080, partial [Vicinamibacterales bacterium]